MGIPTTASYASDLRGKICIKHKEELNLRSKKIHFNITRVTRGVVMGTLGIGLIALVLDSLTSCIGEKGTVETASDTAVAATSGDTGSGDSGGSDTSDTGSAEEISHTMVVPSTIPACKDGFLSGIIKGLPVETDYEATASVENGGPATGLWYMNIGKSLNDTENIEPGMIENLTVTVSSSTRTSATIGLCGHDGNGILTYFAVTATP